MARSGAFVQRGFSLIELVVVMAIVGVLALLSAPSLGAWLADANIRNTSEALLGAVRLAQSTAVASGRTTMVVRTTGVPVWDANASAVGGNWYVRVLPLGNSGVVAGAGDLVQATSLGAQNGVNIAGPSVLCFGAQGRLVAETAALTGVGADCSVPTNGVAAPMDYDLTRGQGRALRLRVYLGGRVRLCDPAKVLSNINPDGC